MFSAIDMSENLHETNTWLVFSGDKIMVCTATQDLPSATLPALTMLDNYRDDVVQYSDFAGKPMPYLVVDLGAEFPQADGYEFVSLRQVMMNSVHSAFDVIGRAWQYVHFFRTHRYCGQCGNKTTKVNWETAVHCQRCGHRCYPRVSPCIIVAIYRDNQILLAQSARHTKSGMYSTIAGFVESGESLEQGVQREVAEEVGVQVTDIEYFGSQPWPFPHALMVGYLARWNGGDIRPDKHEIADAQWFDVDALPFVPPKFSIAGQLIEAVVLRNQ